MANNVTPLRRGYPRQKGGGGIGSDGGDGDDGDIESRLRGVEDKVLVIQTDFKHLATTRDVEKVKVWVLAGVVGGMIVAASLAISILKLFP